MNIEWKVSDAPVAYPEALVVMEQRVEAIRAGLSQEMIWLLEHPPLYTAGTSAKRQDLLSPHFPVYEAGRGGQYTYHGPGQRVAYVMLDLQKRFQSKPDLRKFVWLLEEWIIRTLAALGVEGQRRDGRVGIWVIGPGGREEKIAALGIRVKKWVSFHGIAINVNPDLAHYAGIVPCGISEHGVTSLAVLGKQVSMEELDVLLLREFEKLEFVA